MELVDRCVEKTMMVDVLKSWWCSGRVSRSAQAAWLNAGLIGTKLRLPFSGRTRVLLYPRPCPRTLDCGFCGISSHSSSYSASHIHRSDTVYASPSPQFHCRDDGSQDQQSRRCHLRWTQVLESCVHAILEIDVSSSCPYNLSALQQ